MADFSNVDLVGDSRPVVTPAAVAQLSDAFRKGFIDTADIMDRVSERTKKKQELELITAQQGIANAQDPQLIQAARNQKLAEGATAQNVITTAPLAQQAKTAELKAAIFDAQAKPGGFDLMQTALSKAGFPVNVDPNAGLTDANKSEILKRFSALTEYTQKKSESEDRVKNTETKFFPTEQKLPDGSTTKGQLQKLFRNGQEITSDEFKNWATEAEALKRTPFSQWYSLQSTKPGQVAAPVIQPVAAPAVPVIEPAVAAQRRAQLANAGVPNAATLTDQQVAGLVQPALPTVAPTAASIQPLAPAAIPPQIGQSAPGLGIVTSVEAAPTPAVLRPTEGQQRALLAVPRFQEANAALADLQARNYDPTSWGSWVQSYLPQIAKSGDRKEFETAMSVWSQGLLRLESGAAITPKEQSWYDKSFFPVVGDPSQVVQQKEALRKSVEAMVAELGAAGPVGEDLKRRAQGVYQAADTFTRGASAPVLQGSATGPLRITLPGRGNVEFDPATQRYRPIQ